ncbi:MAG: sigma-70 family RNA polymerase sigma factor [Chloroflexi bacterium]|jgi:RNA polymerase sigma-70 factor, ECF subfamily|nr:sigma-70 family RNA polymerase sigma factor [Chloroflexota bacterium]MBT4533791.1 sigma-70 family RNA polymerase sigma factor [Chloroflexota bacterium]MBT5336910.1 sigma-70 family RNA polymerase sigma factor [Chloroflexota bacterium]MBT6152485.1 sigma-70 family RNA polymerase sigma factor [Chloroflexota bacterium]MBT7825938.1 sigma-70 family RNA polymerase sigma factor [Bacteroidota bacterium]
MPSNEQLLNQARNLDENALTEIYDTYNLELYKYAYRILGDQMQAEDCVSETFNRFLNALHKGKGPKDNIRAYLYRIAHNWITDQFKSKSNKTIQIDIEQFSSKEKLPEIQVHDNLSLERVRLAMKNLTPDQRQVIALKFFEGWNSKEISNIMEKPIGAIKSLQYRAISAMKKLISQQIKEV